MLSNRGSGNSPFLIVFSANYIDQSDCDLYMTEGISEDLTFHLLIWVDHMPKVTPKNMNKTILIIFKNTALRLK